MKRNSVKKMVTLAMFSAIAYLMVNLIRIPVVLFLKYEPKDVIITIGGFLFGPMASFIISGVVSLLEMVTISETGIIGCIMNLLSTCTFACTAAFVYKKKHTLHSAMAGLAIGSVLMVGAMLLWNWLITPLYMGIERESIEGMLLPMFLPFNLLKAGLNSALTLSLYKPLVTALRKIGLVESHSGSSSKAGLYLFAAALLITCILLLLVFQGKL
jgi:riboflavin transporter FmnP